MRQSFVFGLLLLCACGRSSPEPADGAILRESACEIRDFEQSRFTVCDNDGGKLLLFAAGPDEQPSRSFAELARRMEPKSIAFAMNAGMFDEAGRPIGYTIVDGEEVKPVNLRDGPGNFHMKPNGVFMVTCGGRRAIFPSDAIPEFRCAPELTTQSGPMLVIDGELHPRLHHDGSSRRIRNGVGVRDGKALFVISEGPVSLGRFARFFRDVLKTPNALYFDGSVSSLWDPANGRQDSHSPLGPIIVALKPEESKPDHEGRARP
jgi:uncharacterized protein YigE (DUF2233 family)